MGTCVVGGRTIAFERRGAGPPLVFLNGFAATKADWDPGFLEALEADRELILLDNRGMGGSSGDGSPCTIEDMAGDAAGAIAALGLERPDVLGWSMGGFVALALALATPDRVRKLVLLSTSAGGSAATLASPDVRAQLSDLSGTPREQASRLISLLFLPARARMIDAAFGDVVAAARAALPHDVVRAQWRAMEAWEAAGLADRLGEIGAPALIATGSEDVVVPAPNSLALADAIPGSWLARFPGCGHGFMADHPDSLARLISTFLAVD
jgi:pimeloyl-ACP methyl ester carboxylesterase